MKKWIVGVVVAIVALGLVAGGAALAAYQDSVIQSAAREVPAEDWTFPGRPGRGLRGDGRLHEYFLNALAEGLGMTRAELDEKLADGETPLSIARGQGLDDDQIRDLVERARDQALDAAVADGVITEEQAEWLRQRWPGPGFGIMGPGRGCWGPAGAGWGRQGPGFAPFGRPNRPWSR